MYGAIIGDVAGSYYEVLEVLDKKNKGKRSYDERIQIMDKSIPLFGLNSSCTDDSILTCAVSYAILNNKDYEETLRYFGKREINLGKDIYGRSRFGKGFIDLLNGSYQGESNGNGSAMRISPVGYLFNDLEKVKEEARKVTIPSHNNIEAIRCAEAVAVSIFLLRNKISKQKVKKHIEENYFSLDFDLENLRNNYTFKSNAIESVPQAIFCFLEANDFEDSIRKAISIGGDSDTIAAITGSIAEAYYKIPEEIIIEVQKYIKPYMEPTLEKFYKIEKSKVYGKYN